MQTLPLWKIQTVKPMETKTFTVTEENAGNRLDKLLAEYDSTLTRSMAVKLIEDGMVTVNGALSDK